MMLKTSVKQRNLMIYQVFVRNHTVEGTFNALIKDLDRIKLLGTDIVYLLPVHPIGVLNRKGTIGSPYSIQDYRGINLDLGTLADFKRLISEIHARKMKIMMDIVYNHTSRDSVLLRKHPEWFYKSASGAFANRVGDWWDVTDFDFTSGKELWMELTDILKYYTNMGVDGFRCDVASLVPIEFWDYARKAITKINKNVIWLSESVHGSFLKYIRDLGFEAASESEIFQVFDMAYDYDIQNYYEGYLLGKRPLKDLLEGIIRQEEIYPKNYIKMKNLDNHDVERLARLVKGDKDKILNWHGFAFMQKGAVMVYAGSEFSSDRRPDLFEKDVMVRKNDISEFIQTLAKIKKRPVFANGIWTINVPEIDGVAFNTVEDDTEKFIGIFNVGLAEGAIPVNLPDGNYKNLLSKTPIIILNNKITLSHDPVLIRIKK
jgi:cyclomaltodextrinase / maltogenic alpha-amylase / neopullulanase